MKILILFLLLVIQFTYLKRINLANRFFVDTEKEMSLLSHSMSSIRNKFSMYGLDNESKKMHFFIQTNSEFGHLKKISEKLGNPQSIIDNDLAIFTTSIKEIKELQKDNNLIKWVGFFEPHFKFSVKNPENIRKPFNKLLRINPVDKKPYTTFVLVLSNHVNSRYSKILARKWMEEFKNRKISKNFGIEIIGESNSQKMYLKVIPKQNSNSEFVENVYDETLKFFAEKPEVFFVELKKKYELKNHDSQAILQSGFRDITGSKYDFVYRNQITGKNQIVGVSDTGLDFGNCFFYDKDQSVAHNNINPNHRKVLAYFNITVGDKSSDFHDYVDGHGTHVCGSIAGSMTSNDPNQEMSVEHGLAPNAKLAFIDIQNENDPGLVIPADINANLFPLVYNVGARIISNSWGTSSPIRCEYDCQCERSNSFCRSYFGRDCCRIGNEYDSQCQSLDQFLYDHPDTVILFAAGNSGTSSHYGNLGSPSTGKNVLSVGASVVSFKGFNETVNYEDIQSMIDMIKQYGYNINTEAECCAYSGPNADVIKGLCCSSVMRKNILDNPQFYNQNNVADFSSRGPCYDEIDIKGVPRMQPSVVAPGNKIISTHSNGKEIQSYHCGNMRPNEGNNAALLTMQGTSMATPTLAGTTALVREYFEKNMEKHAIDKKQAIPSGVLLKALIIHAAQPMSGIVVLDGKRITEQLSDKFPNEMNGFGLPDLSYILPFEEEQKMENQPNFNIFVENLQYFEKNMSEKTYEFNLKTKKISKFPNFFRATLVWYDSPSDPSVVTSDTILNGDLDLVVEIVGKKIFYGNGQNPDTVNTAERVHIGENDLSDNDVIKVTVKKGERFIIDQVPFSLVVSHTLV